MAEFSHSARKHGKLASRLVKSKDEPPGESIRDWLYPNPPTAKYEPYREAWSCPQGGSSPKLRTPAELWLSAQNMRRG